MYVTRVFVPVGSVLTGALVTDESRLEPGRGKSLLGLSLTAGQSPAGNLSPGDTVDVLATPQLGSGDVLPWPGTVQAKGVEVWSVGAGEDGTTAMTVAVPVKTVKRLSSLAALGQLSVVRSQ